ncbi:MAG: hypothetical protein AB1551_07790 [Actinomycetota bacterium]
MGDEFDELAVPGGEERRARSATDLTAEIAALLGEPDGRLAIVPDEEEMAWLLRDGKRLSSFNLKEADQLSAERHERLVQKFADLVRRYDELLPIVEGLEVGRRYNVDYISEESRRIHRGGRSIRAKGTLLSVSGFRHGRGVGGAGWVLTLEYKPTFGEKSVYKIDTTTLVKIRKA